MKATVRSKGEVTIPKSVRDQFRIETGTDLDFMVTSDGIRLRKVVDPHKHTDVLGCLKQELAGKSVKKWLNELRGPVDLPKEEI